MTKLEEKVHQLDLFVGNLEEYNSLKGVKHVLMDTGISEKYIWVGVLSCDYRYDLWEKLISEGCVGLIHYVAHTTHENPNLFHPPRGYGMPVKKKKQPPSSEPIDL